MQNDPAVASHEVVFPSDLDPGLTVAIIYPESPKYETVQQMFASRGHAFLLHDQRIMVVDGAAVDQDWFSEAHLLVIQAHELGHDLAGHGKNYSEGWDPNIEREADWLCHGILQNRGLTAAASLHAAEYFERYGTYPEEDMESMTQSGMQRI